MNEKVKTFIRDKIVSLKDDLQHYSMVEKDKVKDRLLTLEIEDFNNVLGALNNLEELIKGKDEYIAKLCNDRAELKAELNDLKEFARIMINNIVITHNTTMADSVIVQDNYYNEVTRKTEFDLLKKVVEKYGK